MRPPASINRHTVLGTALAVMAAVAFAFSNASASIAFHGGSNPLTLAAVRFVLPALVLAVWLAIQDRSVWLPRRDAWIAVGLGALTAVYSWALLSAIGAIPLALAIVIFYLFPLVAAIILTLFGWESLGWPTRGAIVLAFVGLALALDPRVNSFDIEGVLLGLIAAIGLGVVIAVSGRVLRTGDSRRVTLHMAVIAAVLLITLCILQGQFALPNTAKGWIGFMAAAFFYAFAMIAFFMSVSLIGPARCSLLCYVEPMVTAALGVVLLGEMLTISQIGGIVMVVVALTGARLMNQLVKQPQS